jgi:hypothetical protein
MEIKYDPCIYYAFIITVVAIVIVFSHRIHVSVS